VGRLGLGLGLGLALGLQLGIGFRRNHSWSSIFTPRRNHSLCLCKNSCILAGQSITDLVTCFHTVFVTKSFYLTFCLENR